MKTIRRYILAALIFLMSLAQELTVKSFEHRVNDLSASTVPRLDNNNVACALVKVQLAARGAEFEGQVMGNVEYKTSEYWVYMPKGSKRLIVKLEGYLPLEVEFSQYSINSLESKATYLLVITGVVASSQPVEVPKQQTGWLILKSNPSEADVYLTTNGVESLVGTTPFQQKLAYGDYRFRLSKPLYHDEVCIAQINQGKVEYAPNLLPAHGRIRVTSSPSGAKVSIDGVVETYTTPCTTAVLASGEYRLRVSKEKFSSAQKTIVVQDGKVVDANFDLAANYAKITINSLSGAEIYVNGVQKGTTSFIDEFTPGVYEVEARKQSHKTVYRQIEVEANKAQVITLNPTPIYGSLDVISDPMEATVTINGKDYGKTPTTIDNLLIGQYRVELTKEGYGPETATVTIEEGKTVELNRKLNNGRELTFTTTPAGADLYVDGKLMGTTPATLTLTYGSHSIKVKNSEAEETDNITVSSTMSKTRFSYELNATEQTFTVKDVSFKMVKVEGGTFTMGATSEQGSDANDNEKPAHQVTLSTYFIGQTEVTQALWKAVMGSNLSNWKGDNLPVEQVSWNDCQVFIRKLNQLTGKKFRLPTEAEWEYAARGGSKSRGYKYAGSNTLSDVAWYWDNSGSKTHAVGTKKANELGLYDMCGNVWVWCQDWYGSYSSGSQTNPTGPNNGSVRVFRGGSWYYASELCRVSFRGRNIPSFSLNRLGLRLVLVP